MSLIGNYTYPANIWQDDAGIFQIRFNDLPEVEGQATSLDQALKLAENLLGEAVADRIQNGQSLPEPLSKEET